MTLGLAAMSLVLLVSEQLDAGMRRDHGRCGPRRGAKGSPMQLILAAVFHLDTPPAMCRPPCFDTLRAHPLVRQAVPLALGDSVGLSRGRHRPRLPGPLRRPPGPWPGLAAAMQAVLGAEAARRTGLDLGPSLRVRMAWVRAGARHDEHHYQVVGVLAPTGGVIDRLVLTDLASVWALHEDHAPARSRGPPARNHRRAAQLPQPAGGGVAAALGQRPGCAQAASPALETARLMRMVGVGEEVLRGFGWVLMAAGLSVGVALLHAVRAPPADLAMLRMLGAPPRRVALLVLAEALCLAVLGAVLGLLAGIWYRRRHY